MLPHSQICAGSRLIHSGNILQYIPPKLGILCKSCTMSFCKILSSKTLFFSWLYPVRQTSSSCRLSNKIDKLSSLFVSCWKCLICSTKFYTLVMAYLIGEPHCRRFISVSSTMRKKLQGNLNHSVIVFVKNKKYAPFYSCHCVLIQCMDILQLTLRTRKHAHLQSKYTGWVKLVYIFSNSRRYNIQIHVLKIIYILCLAYWT